MKKLFTKLTMLLIALTISSSLMAADQVVTDNGDSGAGTLRQAIIDATDGDEITFNLASGSEIITTSSELAISESLTIDGSNNTGSGVAVTVQAAAAAEIATHRVFNIEAGTVTISDMTIRYGKSDLGSGIYVHEGSTELTLENSTICYNTATVSYGGGIYAYGSTLTITNSTINNNLGTNDRAVYGGGILLYSANFNMNNSTVAHNKTSEGGGGIFIKGTSTAIINNSTIGHNHSNNDDNSGGAASYGGGIYLEAGSLAVKNSILANNYYGSATTGGNDYSYGAGTLTDNGFNVVENQTGASNQFGTTNNLLNTDPTGLASSLTYEGGYTEVLKVTAGNIATGNAGSTTETTDQRGYYRTSSAITRGAYQYNGIVAKIGSGTSWTGSSDVYTTIQAAYSAASTGNTIVLAGTPILELGIALNASKTITIQGSGSSSTIVQAAQAAGTASNRVFNITDGTVTLTDMTICNGNSSQSGNGIYHLSGTLTLTNCTIRGNSSTNYGGGIYNEGTLLMTNCTVSSNTISGSTYGSGIENNAGTITMTNCVLSGNTTAAVGAGGGIHNDDGTITMTDCTVSGNEAGWGAGGIYNDGSSASLTLTNCTVSGNSASDGELNWGDGGGIYNYAGTVTLTNCTVSENDIDATSDGYGGGYYNHSGTLNIKNTLIANNTNGAGNDDYYYNTGTLTDNGYNCVEYQSGASTGSNKTFTATTDILYNTKADETTGYSAWNRNNDDLTNQNLNLSSTLADNGGSTETLAVTTASFAISAGIWDASITTDQRGESRHEFHPTIGAYEPEYNQSWTGTTNGDWNTTSNWQLAAIPNSRDNITITAVSKGTAPFIGPTGTADCNNLTISGSSLTIQSTDAGTGSLIVNGTASGNVTVERFLTKDVWHYIAGQTNITGTFTGIMDLGDPTSSTNQFYRWDESFVINSTPGAWIDILHGPTGNGSNNEMGNSFIACTGYAVTYKTDDETLSLSGVPYVENKVIAMTKTTNSTNLGANLVGNPFTSTIAANSNAQTTTNFIDQNSSVLDASAQAVYFWNESADDYTVINNSSDETYIAPGQGFMVIAKDNNGSLEINEATRKHGTATFYKNSNNDDAARFNLFVKDAENRSNSTLITFLPNMTLGLDPSYDARKLKGNPNIALYTRLVQDNGVDFAIQALPDNDIESISITLGIDVSESILCEFSINPDVMEGFPVYLEDTKENTLTNLKETSYNTLVAQSGVGRFLLHFTDISGIGDDNTFNTKTIRTYASGNTLYILNPQQKRGTVTIYNLTGQNVTTFELTGDTKQQQTLNIYDIINIVQIQTSDEVVSGKVIFR